jgi:four helix bundle protein
MDNENYVGFTGLSCWQKSRIQVKFVFTFTSTWTNYTIRNQLERATLSIMNNIAEGYSKKSAKERQRFFDIAMASCSEVESMTYAITYLSICSKVEGESIRKSVIEIRKMIYGLSRSLDSALRAQRLGLSSNH